MFLGAEDATTLLDLARRTLLSIVHGRPLPDLRPPSPSLSEPRGAFVTLYRLEELRAEARQVARRVRLYRTELILEPMPPFERRVVHMALAEYPDITTHSTGDGPSRRVVIKPYP